jgi:hypothetical protein
MRHAAHDDPAELSFRVAVDDGESPVLRIRPASGPRLGRGEDVAEDLLHLVEFGLAADQWGCDLDDDVAAVVGSAVRAVVEERPGRKPRTSRSQSASKVYRVPLSLTSSTAQK